jgi:hypothetical protein
MVLKGLGSITAMLLLNSNDVKGVGEYTSNVVLQGHVLKGEDT